MKSPSSASKVGQCVSLYALDFEEVQWELRVRGGVFVFFFPFSGRGMTSGFTRAVKIPKPDDVRCQVTEGMSESLQSGSLLDK